MLRTAFVVVLIVLVIAVCALGIGGWRISQTMNDLGDTLATMNETQRALLASREKEDRPLAIRGRLYLGHQSKPASYASVDVYALPEGKKVDTLMADKDGRFGTSSLQAGHYTLLAKLVPTNASREKALQLVPDFFAIQSRPISVYPWSSDATAELDIAMVGYGQVSFELTKPLPEAIRIENPDDPTRPTVVYPKLAVVIPVTSQALPIGSLSESSIQWPVTGTVAYFGHNVEGSVQDHTTTMAGIGYGDPDKKSPSADEPLMFWRAPSTNRPDAFRAGTYRAGVYLYFVVAIDGSISGSEQRFHADLEPLPAESKVTIQVVDGWRTHLKITPPDHLEKLFREAVAAVRGDEQKLSAEQQKPRLVKLDVAEQLELIDPEKFLARPAGSFGGGGFGTGGGLNLQGGAF